MLFKLLFQLVQEKAPDKLRKQLKFVKILFHKRSKLPVEDGHKVLLEVCQILNKNRVTYWLTDGTLLGFIRNGNSLEYDTDIDIGIEKSTFCPSVLADLQERYFNIDQILGEMESSLEICLSKNGVKIDFFFFYPLDEQSLYHSAFYRWNSVSAERLDFHYKSFDITYFEKNGNLFPIPENPDFYLLQKYGPDWQIPTKKWDWASDPFNLVKTGIRVDFSHSRNQVNLHWGTIK